MWVRREFQRLAALLAPKASGVASRGGLMGGVACAWSALAAGLLFPFHFNHLFGVLGLGGYTSGLGFPFPTLLHFR
jgi:hypothetical protein